MEVQLFPRKTFQSRIIRLAFILLASSSAFSSALANAEPVPLYRETFSFVAVSGGPEPSEPSSAVSWRSLQSGKREGDPGALKVSSPGSPSVLAAIESQDSATNGVLSEGQAFWTRPTSSVLFYTAEFGFDVRLLTSIRFQTRNSGFSEISRLRDGTRIALLIENTWYISEEEVFQNVRSEWEDKEIFISNQKFLTAPHIPCVGPLSSLRSGVTLPERGTVRAFGLFMDEINDRVRFDNFTLMTEDTNPVQLPFAGRSLGSDSCPADGKYLPNALDIERIEFYCLASNDPLCTADRDLDGLLDVQEIAFGTDIDRKDTDNDGRIDGEEIAEGSLPDDRNSKLLPGVNIQCLPWNTFFDMWNIAEHLNIGPAALPISNATLTLEGFALSETRFTLNSLGERDLLIHEPPLINGLSSSYGTTCSQYPGTRTNLLLSMIQYNKEQDPKTSREFRYALAASGGTGVRAKQIIPFNTYAPTFGVSTESLFVANWLTVINATEPELSTQSQAGDIVIFDSQGVELGRSRVALFPGERIDLAGGHQFGKNRVGYISFTPDSSIAKFLVLGSRYIFKDTSFTNESIVSAFQIGAATPTGKVLLAPASTERTTAVLELINTLEHPTAVHVKISNTSGELKFETDTLLANRSTMHLILDEFLKEEKGSIIVTPREPESIVAVVMHYRKESSGKLRYIFGIRAEPGLFGEHFATYNTFIGQNTELWGVNQGEQAQKLNVSVIQDNGSILTAGRSLSIPAQGVRVIKVDAPVDQLGSVSVQSAASNLPTAGTRWWAIRRNADFAIVVPAAQ